jgi:CBS domain containing-hemolysin-like protein
LSGLLRPDEASDLTGIRLPEHDDYDTIAGLFLRQLGRIPEPGDAVEVPMPVALTPEGEPTQERVAVLAVERMAGLRIDRIGLVSRPVRAVSEDE